MSRSIASCLRIASSACLRSVMSLAIPSHTDQSFSVELRSGPYVDEPETTVRQFRLQFHLEVCQFAGAPALSSFKARHLIRSDLSKETVTGLKHLGGSHTVHWLDTRAHVTEPW